MEEEVSTHAELFFCVSEGCSPSSPPCAVPQAPQLPGREAPHWAVTLAALAVPAAMRRVSSCTARAAAPGARSNSRAQLLRGVTALWPSLDLAAPAAWAAEDLEGRFAVVTGAQRGIGKGVALGLGEARATVFVTGRNQRVLETTAQLVSRAGGHGVPVLCDHSDDAQVARAFEEIAKQTSGKLDILVNNAFKSPASNPEVNQLMSKGAKFYELPLSVWDDVQNVGLRSHYVASYYAAPMLLAAARADPPRRPLLCATSSFGGVTYLFTTAYGVGKAATDRLMRDLQVELGPLGVDCVSLWPGIVLTEEVQRRIREDPAMLQQMVGEQDLEKVAESPLLTGRVVAQLAAHEKYRQPPYVTAPGLTGRLCLVAEVAHDLALRDGGVAGSVAGEVYGPDRTPAPSIRSLGFLGPGALKSTLPESLRFLAEPGGVLAKEEVRIPLEFMAQGPPKEK